MSSAQGSINNQIVVRIGTCIHVLVGTEKGNTQEQADRLLDRILAYRVFPDKEDRMNLALAEVNQGLLIPKKACVPSSALQLHLSWGKNSLNTCFHV